MNRYENKTLNEYFTCRKYLELNLYQSINYHIFIELDDNNELVIELCDKNGNSVNIGNYVDITLGTEICDIREIVLNYLVGNYLYNHI